MGQGGGELEQQSFLTPGQDRLFGGLVRRGRRRIREGRPENNLDPGAFGLSALQQQGVDLASQFGAQPFSAQGQGALDTLLSGQPAFQITPELTEQRNQAFSQSLAPARSAFQDQLGALQDQFGALGLSRSGGIIDASARAAGRFGDTLAAERAGILQNDISASIASQEAARRAQATGLGIEQSGRQFGLGALRDFGGLQRGAGIQQAGVEFGNVERQDPFQDPALNPILSLLGQRTFGLQQSQDSGSGLGSLIGAGIGGGLGFFGGGGISGGLQGAGLGAGIGGSFF